jgi:hypothetical protein
LKKNVEKGGKMKERRKETMEEERMELRGWKKRMNRRG